MRQPVDLMLNDIGRVNLIRVEVDVRLTPTLILADSDTVWLLIVTEVTESTALTWTAKQRSKTMGSIKVNYYHYLMRS